MINQLITQILILATFRKYQENYLCIIAGKFHDENTKKIQAYAEH